MPQLTVKYKSPKTLKLLEDLANCLGFVITSTPKKSAKQKNITINGVNIIPANPMVDISGLPDIFTGKDIEPDKLRKKAWHRD